MITGVAKHGAILPIPKGAKRENCIYIVDLHHWTGTGSDNKYTYDMYIWVDRATGKLTCYTVTQGRDGTGGAYAGYANYTVINTGKKVDYQGIS